MLKLLLYFIYLEDCLILLRDFIIRNIFEHFWGILEFEIVLSIFRDFKISNTNESFWGILEFGTLLSNSFPWTQAGPPVGRPAGPRAPHAETKEMSQFVFALYHFFLGLIFLHHWIIVSQQNYIVNRWFSRKVHQWATIPRYLTTIAVYAVSSSSSSSLSPPVGWRGRALSWSLLQARVQDGGAPPVGSGPLHMRNIIMITIKYHI